MAAELEGGLQRCIVRCACGQLRGFDVERRGFAERDAVAIQPGTGLRLYVGSNDECTQEQAHVGEGTEPGAHHCPPSRCRRSYSSRNLARNKPPGSSGTRCSQASLARRRSRSAGVSERACACACVLSCCGCSACASACCMRARWAASAACCDLASAGLPGGCAGGRALGSAREVSSPEVLSCGRCPSDGRAACCCFESPAGCPCCPPCDSCCWSCLPRPPCWPGGGLRFIAASTARL